MTPERTLVTGGSGFLGNPLLKQLAAGGGELHATTRGDSTAAGSVHSHRIDLHNAAATSALLAKLAPERLVHLAWDVPPGQFWTAPENVDWVATSLHLLRAFAAAGGRRAILAGSCAEYDWTWEGPFAENLAPLAPRTLYGVAKDALRRVAETFAAECGLELAWARLFFLYGPREPPTRLVPSAVRALLAGEPIATTDGTQVRDLSYVDDAAAALVALLASDVTGAVNIASGTGVPVSQVLDLVAAETGRGELIERGAIAIRAGDPPALVADVARLVNEVGFRIDRPLSEGIAATVDWWRAQLAAGSEG